MAYRALLLTVFAAAGAAAPLIAQERVHTLRGIVRDTAGNGLPGIDVLLLSPRRTTVTDASGNFRLDSIPAGERHLIVRRIGYLPVRPTVRLPLAENDTLQIVLLSAPQILPTMIVESEQPGVRGVVGDTGYRALPGTLVELLGARVADTTDDHGRFAFEKLKQGHYVLRVSREGYVARLISLDLAKQGQEYSIFLSEYHLGSFDWANTLEAGEALSELASRLIMEPRRFRMTRVELERYGSAALCNIPRLGSLLRDRRGRLRGEPNILFRGSVWMKNADLCGWSADELDLVEWGDDPCAEVSKSVADRLLIDCGANPSRITGLNAIVSASRVGWVSLWPRN